MESSPYDEEYKLEEDDEPSQVDLYTPSPRPPSQKKHNEVQPVTGPFLFQAKIKKKINFVNVSVQLTFSMFP